MHSNKIAFVKQLVAAGAFLFWCGAPKLALGQSNPAGAVATPFNAAPHPPMKAALAPPPPNLLEGLTLTHDQQVQIDQIREDTKSHLAAVVNDKKLGPEVTNAMARGYQRIENGKIFDVLTPEQQREVRRRISVWKAASQQHQRQFKQPRVLQSAGPSQLETQNQTATSNQK